MWGLDEIRRQLKHSSPRYVILISLNGEVPNEAVFDLRLFLTEQLQAVGGERGFTVNRLGDLDYVLFSNGTSTRLYGSVTEIRSRVVQALSRFAPQSLVQLDPSRLLRSYDLGISGESALVIVEAHAERLQAAHGRPATKERLSARHVQMVEDHWKKTGTQEFARRVIRQQRAYMVQGRTTGRPLYTECYCSVDAVKREVLGQIDLRHSAQTFAALTAVFDRLMLDAYAFVNPNNARCSLNLNVETIFSQEFETFLKGPAGGNLNNMVLEFRVADVLSNMDDFIAGRDFLLQRGAVLALDGLTTRTLGLLDLKPLGIKLAKLMADQDDITNHRGQLMELQQSGITFVLAHTQEERQRLCGTQAGIRIFQGFHLDRMADEGPGVLAAEADRMRAPVVVQPMAMSRAAVAVA